MRATLFVPCALALVALVGCKNTHRASPAAEGDGGAPTELTPSATAEAPLEEPFEPPASLFLPAKDGGVSPVVRKDAPNMRYARLGPDACFTELGRRGIAFEEATTPTRAQKPRVPIAKADKTPKKVKPARPASKRRSDAKATPGPKHGKRPTPRGQAKQPKQPKPVPMTTAETASNDLEAHVLAPVRLRGPLRGVAIHSALPEKKRATSTIEIFDCRLVLALDDFAAMLAERDVVEIVHMSAFRSVRDRGCTPKYTGKQHCGALAVDVGVFKKKDGSTLDVDRDFNGRIGTATCTEGTGPNPVTPAATELWDIVCDSARRGLFHVMLTPNFNVEHKNHFHLEITPDVGWMLIN